MIQRASVDRRKADRRKGYNLETISRLGVERRVSEQRTPSEKRKGWVRVDKWSSIKLSEICESSGSKTLRI